MREINYVAPLVGAWIERMYDLIINYKNYVAPLVGAWIESVSLSYCCYTITTSLLL